MLHLKVICTRSVIAVNRIIANDWIAQLLLQIVTIAMLIRIVLLSELKLYKNKFLIPYDLTKNLYARIQALPTKGEGLVHSLRMRKAFRPVPISRPGYGE